jgi:hypothetical protein
VGENQVVPISRQETNNGILNLLDWQRCLLWPIIEVTHLSLCAHLLQDSVKLGRAVRIFRPAQSHDSPLILRMRQYVSTAP